ncbi:MAG: OmpA family protein [Reichenbachiella sp.]
MKQLPKLIILAFLILIISPAIAQTTIDRASSHKAFKKGERLFNNGNYVEAEGQFQILLDSGYKGNDLIAYQAQIHLELHEPHAAKDVLSLSKHRNEDLDFLLAIAHYYLEEFDDAYRELQLVKDTASFDVKGMHDRIDYARKHYSDPKGYVVQNFGPEVNTQYREYAAVMYDGFNELLFTSRNDSSEYTAHDGMAFEMIHDTSIDSLNNWHVADPFEFHSGHEKRHDATVQVYDGGKKLITFHDGKLFQSHLEDSVWEEDGQLKLHQFDDGIESHCFISDDESYIIFASDYHSLGHNLDLYASNKLSDGTWGEPRAITELNTEFDEDAPFMSTDGTLYFSSRGHGSLGGYDVFSSTYDSFRKEWTTPVNLDYPINTVSEDIYYSTYGQIGFLSSTRVGGHGSLDLYRVLLFNTVKIKGVVLDKETNEPIPYAQIDLTYDSMYISSHADSAGNYELFVPVNKDMNLIFLEDGNKLHEEAYYVDVFFRDEDNVAHNFIIPKGSDELSPEDQKLVHVEMKNSYKNDPNFASVNHDEVDHWADSLNNHYEQIRIANLPPEEPGEVFTYFDYKSDDPGISGREELKELYNDILKESDFTVAVNGHTDTRGGQAYNKRLSHRRAQNVADYLIELGVSDENIIVEGHGETKLLHEDDSEVSHAKNRRVEVVYN